MIYLLEDDSGIRELVAYTLTGSVMQTVGFERPSEFRAALERELPALVILDIMLPEEDGISVLRSLRENPKTAKLPVLMLTAKSTEYDKVIGLDCGADDYLTKPFNILELKARIRALLRRSSPDSRDELSAGAICLNPGSRNAQKNGTAIALTVKEYDLVEFLMKHPNQVFSREALLDALWGDESRSDSRTVDVHIRRLREKLELNPAQPEHILTKWGVGYYFKY